MNCEQRELNAPYAKAKADPIAGSAFFVVLTVSD